MAWTREADGSLGAIVPPGEGEGVVPECALDEDAASVGGAPVRDAPPVEVSPRQPRRRGVVIILPALNEEAAVGTVLDRIPTETLEREGYDVRVWVVDGKSVDATLQIARNKGANIFVQGGDGKGTGVRQALERLMGPEPSISRGGRVFVMLDADGSYAPEAIPTFLDAIESGFDVILGSRFRGHRERGSITPFNLLGNRVLSGLAGFLFGRPVSDVCTGMWAFREDFLRQFGLEATGFDLEADLFAASCESGARVGELPIDYSRRIGEPKLIPFRTGLLIAWRLLVRRLNHPADAVSQFPILPAHWVEETT